MHIQSPCDKELINKRNVELKQPTHQPETKTRLQKHQFDRDKLFNVNKKLGTRTLFRFQKYLSFHSRP